MAVEFFLFLILFKVQLFQIFFKTWKLAIRFSTSYSFFSVAEVASVKLSTKKKCLFLLDALYIKYPRFCLKHSMKIITYRSFLLKLRARVIVICIQIISAIIGSYNTSQNRKAEIPQRNSFNHNIAW